MIHSGPPTTPRKRLRRSDDLTTDFSPVPTLKGSGRKLSDRMELAEDGRPEWFAASAPVVPGFQIEGILGRGGMGVVYKARHLVLKRVVALKMILSGGHAGTGERQRFRAEAEAVARLQHPNIVQVYEVGEHEGLPYCRAGVCRGRHVGAAAEAKSSEPAARRPS